MFTFKQCCRSMTFWYGSGSCYFRHWPFRCQQKTNYLKNFLLISFWRYCTFTSFSKDKKSKRSHKTVGIKFFACLLFLLDDRRIRIWLTDPDPDPGGPKWYRSGSATQLSSFDPPASTEPSGRCGYGGDEFLQGTVTAVAWRIWSRLSNKFRSI